MSTSVMGNAMLQQDLNMAKSLGALTGVHKGLSHVFLGQKYRETITTHSITSQIVHPNVGLPEADKGAILTNQV
ncbi:MAG: hypothetical protein D6E12_16830 [Desulfovibrio sp.]|nr:MAG: hypothetical protein D6E12_16830 [Desulfovibrio sp.]